MVCRLQNCGSLRWNSYPISCLKMWFPKVGIVLIQHSPPGQWSKLKKEVKNTGHFKILRISVIFCMQTNYAWANNIAQVFCNDPLTLSHWPIQWLWVVLQWSSQGLNWSDSSLVAICIYQIFWLVLLQYLMVDIWIGQPLNVSNYYVLVNICIFISSDVPNFQVLQVIFRTHLFNLFSPHARLHSSHRYSHALV